MLEAWCCIPTYDHRSDRKALTLMDLRRQYLENEETELWLLVNMNRKSFVITICIV